MEADDEISGGRNMYTAEFWMYDSRLGRRWEIDPITYPWQSPYACFNNNPIYFTDPLGLQGEGPVKKGDTFVGDDGKTYTASVDEVVITPQNNTGAGYYTASAGVKEAGFAARHPKEAVQIGSMSKGSTNISTNSVRFATRGNVLHENKTPGEENEGSQVNAFRHALWQATIANRFGGGIANEAGNAHEDSPFVNTNIRTFSGEGAMAEADQTIDLLNNVIGRQIGLESSSSGMKNLALKVLDYYYTNGLYSATKGADGTVTVSKLKITTDQYVEMKAVVNGLLNNGFTPAEEAARQKAAKEKLEINQSPIMIGTMK